MRSLTRVAIAITLTIGAPLPLSAGNERAPEPDFVTRANLAAFADRFDRAQLTKDRTALQEMVADDLIFIDGSGQRSGKKAFIDGWTAADDRYDPIVLIDRTIVPLGPDAGIVGAETTLSGTSGGQSFSNRFRFADAFKRTHGRWQAIHIQVTRLPALEAP